MSKTIRQTVPHCPICGRKGKPQGVCGDLFGCPNCGATFDCDPDEGGDYSDFNPAARLERQERWARRKQGRRRR